MDETEVNQRLDGFREELNQLEITDTKNTTNIENIKEKLDTLEEKVDKLAVAMNDQKTEIIQAMEIKFVQNTEFKPVKHLVIGAAATILLAVLMAGLALVIIPVVHPVSDDPGYLPEVVHSAPLTTIHKK